MGNRLGVRRRAHCPAQTLCYTSAVQIEEIIVQAERIIRIGLTLLFTYFVALWIAAIWWTFHDIRLRSADAPVQIAATLLVAIFNFPGLLIYLMLRPPRTIADLYNQSLEEEALLRTVGETIWCPSCQEPVEPDFLFCPSCQARLRQRCQRCERPILLRWRLCPYCGASPSTVSMSAASSRELVKP